MSNNYTTTRSMTKRKPLPPSSVEAGGELRQRLELSHSYLINNAGRLFVVIQWGADQIGCWLSSVATLSEYLKTPCPVLEEKTAECLKLQ